MTTVAAAPAEETTQAERSLLEVVDHFTALAGRRLFAEESPDGDLAAVDPLLSRAAEIGLLADPAAESGTWGAWGTHADDGGPALTLAMLRHLARTCAGLATTVHAQGIAARLLGGTGSADRDAGASEQTPRRLTAAFTPPAGLPIDPRNAAAGLRLSGSVLTGDCRYSVAPGTPDAVAVAARTEDGGWAVIELPQPAAGMTLVPTGLRIGLRAATFLDVRCEETPVTDGQIRARGAAARTAVVQAVACDWLGQAAIALGTAEQAVAEARSYTATRVQGGTTIGHHPAVRLLLARAEHDLAVLDALLTRHAHRGLRGFEADDLLRWAMDCRVAAGELAGEAVTQALQTLGGYGYMDEYGISKRLRDVTSLRVLHGGPDQLLLARHDLGEEA